MPASSRSGLLPRRLRALAALCGAALALGACTTEDPNGSAAPTPAPADATTTPPAATAAPSESARALVEVTSFGANPGALRMFVHSPTGIPANAPLVVVLHGCTQSATEYRKAGWDELADRHGFHVVYAQQERLNNSSRCFNWFLPTDANRGQGEALSIRSMVDHMVSTAGVDRTRVFASGLSAGGAMTAVVLAAYPDVFAAGAVNAGLPYKCARAILETSDCLAGRVLRSPREWGDFVRAAHPGYQGPYPRVTIWHGTADTRVVPANATELVEQWTDVHGTDATADTVETVRGHQHSVYRTADGRPVVDSYSLTGMGHGTAVDPGGGTDQGGTVGQFFFDHDLHSTYHAGRFFGLVP